jgi:hypothetical protein
LRPEQVWRDTILLGSMDMLAIEKIPPLTGTLIVQERVTVYGVCGWFNAEMAEGLFLRTGPLDPKTHWAQVVFPLPTPVSVKEGESVSISIEPILSKGRNIQWRWSIKSEEGEVEMNDMLESAVKLRSLEPGWI